MPRGVYEIKCKNTKHSKFSFLPHQTKAADYFLTSPFKGLLLYFLIGSGKTSSSILIADKMLQAKKVKHVYILTPGSLRENWVTEYCEKAGKDPKDLQKYFTFVTTNFFGSNQIQTFDDSLVIIDEIHNFINAVTHQSKTAQYLYAKLSICNKCRIIALSGTPIYKDIAEFSLLGNLLKPGAFPNVIISGEYNPEEFYKLFKENKDGTFEPLDPNAWKKSLQGIIFYFSGIFGEFYPQVIYEPVIKAIMSKDQEKNLIDVMKREAMFRGMDMKAAKNMGIPYDQLILSKKYLLTRSASNFLYPPNAFKNYNKYKENMDMLNLMDKLDKKELLSTGFRAVRLERIPDDLVENDGWISQDSVGDGKLKIYSEKFVKLFNNILDHPRSKHAIYTIGRDISGAYLIHNLLKRCGVDSVVFTGDLNDQQRKKLLENFNNYWNRFGQITPIIIFTKAGAEGITLKDVQHLHIVDSDPRGTLINQVIGRANRFKSHENLPAKFRILHVWRYFSVFKDDKVKGIDELLYNKADIQITNINSFLQTLINASI